MARHRSDEAESESLKSSSSVSEDDVGEGEEEFESEEENAQKPFFSKKVEIAEKSEESEGDEEEEEDDVKAPRPIEPKSTASAAPPAESRAAAKRAAPESENVGDRDSKRAKENSGEGTKKSTFERVFSEDDEVVILEGFIEFKAKTGAYPGSKINDFRNFISKSLPFEVTSTQLYEKIRRLKKRYENNLKKGKDTFKIPHEQKVFDLSREIWETVVANDAVEVYHNSNAAEAKINQSSSKKERKKEVDYAKAGVVNPITACLNDVNLSAEEWVLKHGLEIIDGPKKLELEEKWKQLRVEEIKLHVKRLKLLSELGNSVLEALD